jgi:hypothetical protein
MKLWNKTSEKKQTKSKRAEDFYEVEITDTFIKVIHPSRPVEQIEWTEIEEIKLVNTDEGPFLPDVWLILMGNGKGCSLPQGSGAWDKVYDIVSKYEGFNFENVIASSCCAENKIFDLWKK